MGLAGIRQEAPDRMLGRKVVMTMSKDRVA
jgi:hypothetical protein